MAVLRVTGAGADGLQGMHALVWVSPGGGPWESAFCILHSSSQFATDERIGGNELSTLLYLVSSYLTRGLGHSSLLRCFLPSVSVSVHIASVSARNSGMITRRSGNSAQTLGTYSLLHRYYLQLSMWRGRRAGVCLTD